MNNLSLLPYSFTNTRKKKHDIADKLVSGKLFFVPPHTSTFLADAIQ